MPNVESAATIITPSVLELVAIGAAIACNCEHCFKFHYDKARKLGVSKEDMLMAVQTAHMVKESPARSIADLAQRYLASAAHNTEPITDCSKGCH
jgi:AhpD family alkylhydroperoxidase